MPRKVPAITGPAAFSRAGCRAACLSAAGRDIGIAGEAAAIDAGRLVSEESGS
jgi:dissimilatory sulfite reductase (desulfoviridin) alpha/beta subunit